MLEKNNLFSFATKETTQDSLISYLVQWFNSDDTLFKYISEEFLKIITPPKLMKKIGDFENVESITITRQCYDIDILLIFNMENKKQYFLIIEDKTSSNLTESQRETCIYYSKLVGLLNKSFECQYKDQENPIYNNFKLLGVDFTKNDFENKVFSVLVDINLKNKVSLFEEEQIKSLVSLNKRNVKKVDEIIIEKVKNEINGKFQKAKDSLNNKEKESIVEDNLKILGIKDLNRIVYLLGAFKGQSDIIREYHAHLKFYLENDNLLLSSKHNNISLIKEFGLKENETHFRTGYLCLNCFNEITNPRTSSVILLNNDNKEIKVQMINTYNGNEYQNEVDIEYWYESNVFDEIDKDMYIILFVKDYDAFRNDYCVFKGLYHYVGIDNKKGRIWKKIKTNDGIVLVDLKDIEKYIQAEELHL